MPKEKKKTCPEDIRLTPVEASAEGFVIGVDGGGTKTLAVLTNLKGKILRMGIAGPSSPRNVGIKIATENIAKAIKKVLKRGEILSTFIGLASVEEEFKFKKKEIKKELLKHKEISPIFKGRVIIGSDQIAAFRSGTDEKNGVLLIAGTGCVVHGWYGRKEVHVSGWGWLADEGSAFWAGQKAFQAIFKDLDGRGPKTLITKLVFQKLKIKNKENLLLKIYSKNPTEIIPLFSFYCDIASKKRDKVAKNIMIEAGKELALAAKTVIRKLNLQKSKFPLVLVGSMFKSKIVLDIVKKEVKKVAPKTEFIRPKREPVIGAVKLALDQIKIK